MSALPWEPLIHLKDQFKAAEVVIGKNVTIHPSAVIEGPVVIGDNCVIGVGAYIRPYSRIGNNCVIGHATEIKHCILGDNVVLPHFNYVGDSIVGNNVHLGGGAVIANYKSDGTTIHVELDGKKVDTSLNKFGAMIGNNVEIGSGCIINPGSMIGNNTTIYAGAIVRGSIPDNVIVKYKQTFEIVPKQ